MIILLLFLILCAFIPIRSWMGWLLLVILVPPAVMTAAVMLFPEHMTSIIMLMFAVCVLVPTVKLVRLLRKRKAAKIQAAVGA